MNDKKLTQNTFFYTSALAIQKALAFFYFIILARGIGVENTGRFTLALSFTAVFSMILDFGLNQVLIRETAKDKTTSENYLNNIISIKIIASIFIYLLIVILVNLMGYPQLTKNLIYISGLVMIFDSYALSVYGSIRGHQNLLIESLGTILNQIIVLLLGSVLIFLKVDLLLIMSAYFWASTVNFSWAIFNLRRKFNLKLKLKLDFKIIKYLLILSFPFALAGIFNRVFSSIDIILLSKLRSDYEVGIYSVAFKIAFALQFTALAFSASIYPAFSYYFTHQKEKLTTLFTQSIYWLSFLALPLTFGVIAISDKAIVPVFGLEYQKSIEPLNILMLSLFFVFLCFPIGAMLNASGKQSRNTWNLLIVALFSIIANLFLIPIFGYIGTAWANLLSYILLFILGVTAVDSIIKYPKKELFWSFLKIIMTCLIMYLFVILIKESLHFIITIILGIGLYFLVAYWLKLFKMEIILNLIKDFRPIKPTNVIIEEK